MNNITSLQRADRSITGHGIIKAFWCRSAMLTVFAVTIFSAPANAALVNLDFSGAFETGETVSGRIVYEADNPNSAEESFEVYGFIRSFVVNSSKFIGTSGGDTLRGVGTAGATNRISFAGGDFNKSDYYPGFNYLQFGQFYGMTDHREQMQINIGGPVQTFTVGQTPSSFSFGAGGPVQSTFYYIYPDAYGSVGARADLTSITASPVVAPVPEPATWAMMVGGFALVGGAMRVRRRVVMAV